MSLCRNPTQQPQSRTLKLIKIYDPTSGTHYATFSALPLPLPCATPPRSTLNTSASRPRWGWSHRCFTDQSSPQGLSISWRQHSEPPPMVTPSPGPPSHSPHPTETPRWPKVSTPFQPHQPPPLPIQCSDCRQSPHSRSQVLRGLALWGVQQSAPPSGQMSTPSTIPER